MLLSREGKVIQIHSIQMSVTLLGNPGMNQFITTSDTSESEKNLQGKKQQGTLGLQSLQQAGVCLAQQLSAFDLGRPTSAPFHLRGFLGLGLLSVPRSAPFPSDCLNPGWDLLS